MHGNNERLILGAAQTVGLGISIFQKMQMLKTALVVFFFFSLFDGERTAAASASAASARLLASVDSQALAHSQGSLLQ